MSEKSFSENVAVITGASSGIGHATALDFARQGYDLVLVARRKDALEKVAAECENLGVETLVVIADISDESAADTIAEAAIKQFGHIDIWLNNAGVYIAGKFEETPMDDARKLFDTNFFGCVYGSRAALKQFRSQTYGTLINISSVNATAPQPFVGLYSASKAAIRALDESLRMELRLEDLHKTIHVCTVMPAAIDTNLFQNAANYTGHKVLALEPVYDPLYAAKRISSLANHPRREMIVGAAGRMMELQNAHSPGAYERQISKFTEKDMLAEIPVESTHGNLFDPIKENTGISGGWRTTRVRGEQVAAAGVAATIAVGAGIAGLGYYLYKRSDH